VRLARGIRTTKPLLFWLRSTVLFPLLRAEGVNEIGIGLCYTAGFH
jgi:hypothetical protein